MIRQPIITVLGHVDHGKTSLLDAIRSTAVASREAGAITQHIGATEVPLKTIMETAGPIVKKFGFDLKIPGLLFIDTPGHEAFTNLRKRGGKIADLAVLTIDATQGLQQQTIEAIEILKEYKVPFIIAMNKIDLLNFYSSKKGSFLENLAEQNENTQRLMDEKLYTLVGNLYKHGFEGERFDRCEFGKQIPIVPCSAKTGEGIPEILTLLSGLSQKYLAKQLEISEDERGEASVLEEKEEKGLGKTLDVILYKGTLKVNDSITIVGKNGIIETKIRALLQPKPLQEIRVTTEKFDSVKKVFAATGVKIAAPNLEGIVAGSTLLVEATDEEKKELETEIESIKIDSTNKGIILKADAIGSLEALIGLLKKCGMPIRKADIGNVTRKDVMEASSLLEEDKTLATILAFNTSVDSDAEEQAKKMGVKIFNEKVIYKLLEEYEKWAQGTKRASKEARLSCLVMPVEFELLRGNVFRNNKPAIVGVKIIAGKLKTGWKVMNKEGKVIGEIDGIQKNSKSVDKAEKGDELAVSIRGGNVGRNLFEGEHLFSCIPTSHYCELQELGDFSEDEKNLLAKIMETKLSLEQDKEDSA
ncbi:MAG: translation initiation factor IF-2 [archaeon]|jgi:translation initiation factor 5B